MSSLPRQTFLTAEWRKLIMAQYEVAPEVLLPHVPPGLELDCYSDPAEPGGRPRCFVSIVGFLFDRVRILGCGVPLHTRFPEINLRFYVARCEADGTRKRGVVFLSEIVPRSAITLVARGLYEEPYSTLPMRHAITTAPGTLDVAYDLCRDGTWQTVAVTASAESRPMLPGSPEEFITEHYFGYTRRTRGATSEYAVNHPRWSIYPIRSTRITLDCAALYGPAFAGLSSRAPDHVLLAEGSAITVSTGTRLAT